MDENLAKDILQETYIKIFKALQHFEYKNEATTFSWMKQISINESLKMLKKNKRKLEIEGAYKRTNTAFNQHELHIQDLYKALTKLPEKQRIVFNLYAVEGYKHNEIAKLLEIKEEYSRTLLARARKFLNQNISKTNYVAI